MNNSSSVAWTLVGVGFLVFSVAIGAAAIILSCRVSPEGAKDALVSMTNANLVGLVYKGMR